MAQRKRAQLTVIEHGALTEKQSAFVVAYVSGGGKLKHAAVDAGYAEGTAHVEAWRLMKNPLIQQAIYQETRARFAREAPEMQKVIKELARTAKSGMVRLLAAQDWLDRAGFKAVEQHQHLIAGELKVHIDLG